MNRLAERFSKIVERFLPDAFVIAVILMLLMMVIALVMNPSDPLTIVESYGDGFWAYLTFTMQMILLLMTGMALAKVPFIERFLIRVASLAKSANQAYVLTFLVTSFAYYINWGLAVIVGAIIAREVGKRNQKAHFPLLVAAAYAPTVLYTAGLSSSIGLSVATEGHFLESMIGVIPTSETIFHSGTIIILLALLITMPIFLVLMAPKKNIIPFVEKEKKISSRIDGDEANKHSFASRLEHARIWGIITGIIGLLYVFISFFNGRDLDLNIINLTFLSLGLLCHQSLFRYAEAFKDAATSISPIILQFPFYAGIIAVLGSSGLAENIVNWMASVASTETFRLFTYWTAGFVNLLAPSGGGQWALQGPLQVAAGAKLGVDHAITAMAVGWGDGWTNLIQPFWALPILSVVGLHIRHIMGYCILLSVWVGVITSILIFWVY
ncbi:short-chain fatty acid transporter [Cytobacillus sp. Sa5YUA1]|uniref:Short-chain fatty acid transporter n=1 Tax=Cytobacillus stercorigallinarum TaxID=2762240 RepID=A0ABR8QP34_9BACI|nr:short-chain fatty acid transporter [Cytobacillus stercorigallinarum]